MQADQEPHRVTVMEPLRDGVDGYGVRQDSLSEGSSGDLSTELAMPPVTEPTEPVTEPTEPERLAR